jgi:magnesium transporter
MNEIMKMLTVIATIFLPISFIASVYGMNFDHMPELHWRFGYPLALALMATVAVGMLSYFKRRGWLRGDPSRQDERKGDSATGGHGETTPP